jgi:methionine sulfoxide reductase heme-binding subunit
MAWIKSSWRWSALNLSAVLIFVLVLTQGSTDWYRTDTFDPGLESGKWAIRILLACLTMTPLKTYFGWSSAVKLRKSAGLWAFGFASLHVLFYIRDAKLDWLSTSMPLHLALGLTGMIILTLLAVTSNRWSMKQLGRNWKRLHRFVYLAGITVVTHSMLALTRSKKLHFRDPQAEHELKVYLVVLSVLLVVRIPLVRQSLKQIPIQWKRYRSIQPVPLRESDVEQLPKIHGRESGISMKPTFIIPAEMPDLSIQEGIGEPLGRIIKNLENCTDKSQEETDVQEVVVR